MNKRRLIHCFDDGPLKAALAVGLGERFHGWRGVSGKRHLTTVFRPEAAPLAPGAVAILTRRIACGAREPVHVARLPGDGAALVALCAERGADEVHVHLIATEEHTRRRVFADLVSDAFADATA